jgi:hypothetical protein
MEGGRLTTPEASIFQPQSARTEATISPLERLGVRLEGALVRKPWAFALAMSVIFLVCASIKAHRATFWFDEVLTFYISSLPRLSDIWRSLMAHADASPPGLHVVTKLSAHILGWNRVGLRLPAMLGYLAMMLCVYFIVRRYAGSLYAMIAALAGFLTYAPFYATDARPYGMVLGLSSIALLCWQNSSGRFRWYAVPGLFLSLAVAVSLHYYAVLTFAAIGFGEIVRNGREHRIDWPVWGALTFAVTPLCFFLPLIRSNVVLSHGGNVTASLSSSIDNTVLFYLPNDGIVFAAFVVVTGICVFLFGMKQSTLSATYEVPPIHVLATWVVLLLMPLEAFILGRLVTGVYQARYAIVTVIGFSILLPLWMRRLFRGSRSGALITLLFLVLCFAGWYKYSYLTERYVNGFTTILPPWLRASNPDRLPIVIADPIVFLPLAHSAPEDLRDLLVYTPEGREAVSYGERSAGDYCLAGLRGDTPLNLPRFSEFTSSHKKFLLLCREAHLEETDWIAPKLRDSGARFRFYSALGPNALVLVDFPAKNSLIDDHLSKRYGDWACMPSQ